MYLYENNNTEMQKKCAFPTTDKNSINHLSPGFT